MTLLDTLSLTGLKLSTSRVIDNRLTLEALATRQGVHRCSSVDGESIVFSVVSLQVDGSLLNVTLNVVPFGTSTIAAEVLHGDGSASRSGTVVPVLRACRKLGSFVNVDDEAEFLELVDVAHVSGDPAKIVKNLDQFTRVTGADVHQLTSSGNVSIYKYLKAGAADAYFVIGCAAAQVLTVIRDAGLALDLPDFAPTLELDNFRFYDVHRGTGLRPMLTTADGEQVVVPTKYGTSMLFVNIDGEWLFVPKFTRLNRMNIKCSVRAVNNLQKIWQTAGEQRRRIASTVALLSE